MTIKSRWGIALPRCSLQQWIFGSSQDELPDTRIFLLADDPDKYYLTLREYRLLSKRIALGLQAEGLRRGDRVLVFSGNSIWYPAVFCGVLMAGSIFTGANPTYVARELAHQLRDSGASIMLATPDSLGTAIEAAAEARLPPSRVFVFDAAVDAKAARPAPGVKGRSRGARHWTELLHHSDDAAAERWDWVEPADPAVTTCCLNYSSGTTGVPKGVEITHAAYVANGEAVIFLDSLAPSSEEKLARARGLAPLPLYHAYGQSYFIANSPRLRRPVYIMPHFDFAKMLAHIQKFKITALALVPPIVVALAKHPLVSEFDLSSIENVGCGAAPLGREAAQECETRLWPGSDVTIMQGWGLTEMTCACTAWDRSRPARRTSAVGEMMPNCSARLMSVVPGDGGAEKFISITEPNSRGELWVTGPYMMKGYWRNHAATNAAVWVDPQDGTRWLRTGDIAYVEEYGPGGIFHIVDRLKELIKVKGNQVAPAELEGVLLKRPDIADAAVVGVTIGGEELPRAYIVAADPAKAPEPREIARWFEGMVAPFKRLKGGVALTDAIPKNPSGKILRKVLRDRAKLEVGDKTPPESKLT